MSKAFQKKVEDFKCEHCGTQVKGSGFTNHCPNCLWSKHVDKNPGDREAKCQGIMRPVKVEKEGNEYILTHRCEICGHEKRNKTNSGDDFDEVVKIAQKGDLLR